MLLIAGFHCVSTLDSSFQITKFPDLTKHQMYLMISLLSLVYKECYSSNSNITQNYSSDSNEIIKYCISDKMMAVCKQKQNISMSFPSCLTVSC